MAERKIILSADSTCDLNFELKERYNVHYYPLHIIYRGKDYKDNIEIFPEDIFSGYYEDKTLPQTSAVNVEEYYDYFKPFVDEGYDVIHINLGSALSSSYEHAKIAAEQLGHVYPIDSQSLSTGTGQLVIRAGKLIEEGLPVEEVVSQIGGLRENVHASFVLDTMDFLAAGGRCPQILAHVTSALKIKPEIIVDNADGSMHMGKIYRGKIERVLKHYVEDTLARYPDIKKDDMFITHSGIAPELVEIIRNTIEENIDIENVHETRASCTISSHCGPGTVGILFVTETPSK